MLMVGVKRLMVIDSGRGRVSVINEINIRVRIRVAGWG
jgi:hypothetical protein